MDEHNNMSHIRRVAIIGAGNAGVTAAKYLLAEERFTAIDVFEQRACAGGLWNYTPENDRESSFSIPQTTANAPLEEPIWRKVAGAGTVPNGTVNGGSSGAHPEPTFVSPIYERLESNLPKMIMQHCDAPFPDDEQLFATHEATCEYLERYADDIRHLIHFQTQILKVQQTRDSTGATKWLLDVQRLGTAERGIALEYHALVVASGHFSVPFVPDIPGLLDWNKQRPDSVTHSKFFRKPEEYAGKRTLTLGRGYSGLDIAGQIIPHCKQPLLMSTRQPGEIPLDGSYVMHPEITRLDVSSRTAYFVDGSSVSDIDAILFCTGYLYSYPFLSKGSLLEEAKAPIWTLDGVRPHNLYKYIFYNADPTLAFLSMPQQIVPFPVTDTQAAVVARVWAGRLDLPTREDMKRWEEKTVAEMGNGKGWLWLKPPKDGKYLNELAAWADAALPGRSVDGALRPRSGESVALHDTGETTGMVVNGDVGHVVSGKEPARWGEKDLWIRERVLAIKQAFVAHGEGRHEVRSLEALGFDFLAWKEEQQIGGVAS